MAVSTGVDSMVLLHLLEQQKIQIGIVHVNHQLRTESIYEALLLVLPGASIAVLFKIWEQPAKKILRPKRVVYVMLFLKPSWNKKITMFFSTAHHGDDQLETLLMRLAEAGHLSVTAGLHANNHLVQGRCFVRCCLFLKKRFIVTQKKRI